MPSSFDSVNSQLEIEQEHISFFSDTITGIRQTISGLAQLAGIEGLDTVARCLEQAVDECDLLLGAPLNVHPTSDE